MNSAHKWQHPYEINPKYQKKVAYFSMEFGIDQALKIYSGGLGFLAGSHMKSAYSLRQNLIGIGMLWKYGYYNQVRNDDRAMRVQFMKKFYDFLEDTGITVPVYIYGHQVLVRAFYLPPGIFHTVPIFLLSTDFSYNDHLARTITYKLYDSNRETRIAQQIVLGIGGAKVVEALGGTDIHHMNEAHALPLCFHLYDKYNSADEVKNHVVFTTHTPEKAGNEENKIEFLRDMGYFDHVPATEVKKVVECRHNVFNHTAAALQLSKAANGVSSIHAKVANGMWNDYRNIPEIIPITNAQNKIFWTDKRLKTALENDDIETLKERKRELKTRLFEEVADQCGKIFDPDVLTVVWARRFAEYKRADLILRDIERFLNIIEDKLRPIQIIWAGKPYPEDHNAIRTFNYLEEFSFKRKNIAVLFGYEINLSRKLKHGADIWLNNPRIPREASGTSGMTAAKNGTINLSTLDGWIPEFARHGENAFILPVADLNQPVWEQDNFDAENLYRVLEDEIIPIYYDNKAKWWKIILTSMREIAPKFDSNRMADEYYSKLY